MSVSSDNMSKVCVVPDHGWKMNRSVQPISEGGKCSSSESRKVCINVEPRLEVKIMKLTPVDGACWSVCLDADVWKNVCCQPGKRMIQFCVQ